MNCPTIDLFFMKQVDLKNTYLRINFTDQIQTIGERVKNQNHASITHTLRNTF